MHPDEAAVAHGAPVHQRAVAHRDVFAQRHGPAHVAVQHGVVLHVGVLADGQSAVVAPQHGPVPDSGAGLQHHITLHGGVGGHEDCALVAGEFSTKRQEHC